MYIITLAILIQKEQYLTEMQTKTHLVGSLNTEQ